MRRNSVLEELRVKRLAVIHEEKVDKYQDLAREIKRLWKVEARVIPIVIGALGMILRGLEENLRTFGIKIKIELIQKVALLGTTRMLRKVLEHG